MEKWNRKGHLPEELKLVTYLHSKLTRTEFISSVHIFHNFIICDSLGDPWTIKERVKKSYQNLDTRVIPVLKIVF